MTEALEIERRLHNEEGESINLNAIGKIYEKWDRSNDAIFFYRQALAIDQRHNNTARIAIRLSSIGSAYTHLDYDSALSYQQQALDIERKKGNRERIGIRLGRIGEVYQKKKDFLLAEGYFKQALDVFSQLSIAHAQANMLLNLARNQKLQGKSEQALQYYLDCITYAEELKASPLKINAYQEVATLFGLKGDFKRAYRYLEASLRMQDTLFSQENLRLISEFKEKYESEKKEKENQLLQKDLEIKAKSHRLSLVLLAGLALLLLILVALYRVKTKLLKKSNLLFESEHDLRLSLIHQKETENRMLEDRIFAEQQINRLQREKHEVELEFKNTKLVNATVCLINKNEILTEVMHKLKLYSSSSQLDNIIKFIQSNTDSDQDWHRFKIDFEQSHPGFFDRLHSKYYSLSEFDSRLCAFLLIGLSTKEISRVMNLSLDAVSKSRQRLRKKMMLEPETDLAGVLKAI